MLGLLGASVELLLFDVLLEVLDTKDKAFSVVVFLIIGLFCVLLFTRVDCVFPLSIGLFCDTLDDDLAF